MLPRSTYRKAVQMVQKIRRDHELDRQENPTLLPAEYGRSIRNGLEYLFREEHIKGPFQSLIDEFFIDQVKKNVLFKGDDGYYFCSPPTKSEIVQQALKHLDIANN